MEDYPDPPNPMLRKSGARKKSLKQEVYSTNRRSTKHSNILYPYSDKPLQRRTNENAYYNGESDQSTPIEEQQVLKKLKRERKFLKKWTLELNEGKNKLCTNADIADEFSFVDSEISEIEKRYHSLLPAIKLAMETMEQVAISKSSLNHASSMNNPQQRDIQTRIIQGSLCKELTTQVLAERKRPRRLEESKERMDESEKSLESKQFIAHKEVTDASINSRLTDRSKQELAKRAGEHNIQSKSRPHNTKTKYTIDSNYSPSPSSAREPQYWRHISARHVKEPSIKNCKPGVNGESLKTMNVFTRMKQLVKVKEPLPTKSAIKSNVDENVLRDVGIDENRKIVRDATKTPQQAITSVESISPSSPNFRKVEQNVLCTRPNVRSAYSTPSFSGDIAHTPSDLGRIEPPSQRSLKTTSTIHSTEQPKCKCKDKIDRKPCICKCNCEEESAINDAKMSQEVVVPSIPSYSSEAGRFLRRKHSLESKNRQSMQVQTSFPSSIGPCNPNTCPKRRRNRFVENRNIEVQTDDTAIEWQYEPTSMKCPKRNVISAFKIPPKRTKTMDDRLLRRIMYFDHHESSVCNKSVQFCTYSVHQTKKGFPKNVEKVACSDCPGSRKCNLVLSMHPYHLTCNEIVVEVKSLQLNQEGVDCLKKVCSFLYIDYVFLGHVGNETSLAPVSNNVLFDSRKSYSVSLRFNKKERSILREQFSPSGLLVKDTIMFIVVCQAAPEFDINKNWDFGFGYLPMKQIGEQMGSEEKICTIVEIRKIGGTKNDIGRLMVTIEGLNLIRSIMNEELRCIEPNVDAVMKKLQLNKKELIAAQNNQTTCKRRKSKK